MNVTDTFSAAMIYVMLSRVCALWQIFILKEFNEAKMYPNVNALKELDRLDKISLNENPTEWEKDDCDTLKITSLNCRSLKKHYEDILCDAAMLKSDIICLQETWIENDDTTEDLNIPNYNLYLNSKGKGKGVAAYCKNGTFRHETNIKDENMQISKFSSSTVDVIVIYRSQMGHYRQLNQFLEAIIDRQKPQLVIGDFNFCYLENPLHQTKTFLEKNKFSQLIKEPTHIEGHVLDQAYLRDVEGKLHCSAELHSKYYSDHKGLAIMIKKGIWLHF